MAKPKETSAVETKAAEAKRDAIMDAESKDSPVLSLLYKRLRAARKKLKKVEELEAVKASGKEINNDQVPSTPHWASCGFKTYLPANKCQPCFL